MSRQNKNVKKRQTAKQFSEIRKGGGKGPEKTSPKHGKKKENRLWSVTKRGPKDSTQRNKRGEQ